MPDLICSMPFDTGCLFGLVNYSPVTPGSSALNMDFLEFQNQASFRPVRVTHGGQRQIEADGARR